MKPGEPPDSGKIQVTANGISVCYKDHDHWEGGCRREDYIHINLAYLADKERKIAIQELAAALYKMIKANDECICGGVKKITVRNEVNSALQAADPFLPKE